MTKDDGRSAEQARFLGIALRSLLETVACQHIIHRRGYLNDPALLRQAYKEAQVLSAQLQSMRKAIAPDQPWLREPDEASLRYHQRHSEQQHLNIASVRPWSVVHRPTTTNQVAIIQHPSTPRRLQ